LAIPENIRNSVIKFCSEVSKIFDIERMLLFGSYASGTFKEYSDIDIAVQIRNKNSVDKIEIGKKLWKIAGDVDIRIEPKIFFSDDYDPNEPASIFNYILRTGIDIPIN